MVYPSRVPTTANPMNSKRRDGSTTDVDAGSMTRDSISSESSRTEISLSQWYR